MLGWDLPKQIRSLRSVMQRGRAGAGGEGGNTYMQGGPDVQACSGHDGWWWCLFHSPSPAVAAPVTALRPLRPCCRASRPFHHHSLQRAHLPLALSLSLSPKTDGFRDGGKGQGRSTYGGTTPESVSNRPPRPDLVRGRRGGKKESFATSRPPSIRLEGQSSYKEGTTSTDREGGKAQAPQT